MGLNGVMNLLFVHSRGPNLIKHIRFLALQSWALVAVLGE